ncbi:atherin-like [Helicoverpa armigera]|uniref:atherin-like n=1 Tax=Helicoverpa armigera TaxID=29058 RepID=UPI003082AA18
MGLDDSATAEEVVAAVARTGGCSADEVKAGTIRPDFRGTCTITVSCPVTAAKNIVDGRRLLVGWVSAQVKLLDPRPLSASDATSGIMWVSVAPRRSTAAPSVSAAVSPVTRPWNAAPRRTALHVRLLASRPNTGRGARPVPHPPSRVRARVGRPSLPPPSPPQWPPPQLLRPPPPPTLPPLSPSPLLLQRPSLGLKRRKT